MEIFHKRKKGGYKIKEKMPDEVKEKLSEAKEKIVEKAIEKIIRGNENKNCPAITKPSPDFCKNGRIKVEKNDKDCIAKIECVSDKNLPK